MIEIDESIDSRLESDYGVTFSLSEEASYGSLVVRTSGRNLIGGQLEIIVDSWMDDEPSLIRSMSFTIDYVDEDCTLTQENIEGALHEKYPAELRNIYLNATIGGPMEDNSIDQVFIDVNEAF